MIEDIFQKYKACVYDFCRHAINAIKSALRMSFMSADEANKITLRVTEASDQMVAGARYTVKVILHNGSNRQLSSCHPHLFYISYHWLDEATGAPVVFDGLRTQLIPPCQPDSEQGYEVMVKAPDTAGRFLLKVVPVQEMVRWHESANPANLAVEVMHNVFGHHPSLDIVAHQKQLFHNGQSRPVMLICETVNVCNNDCMVCAYSSMGREKQHMSMALFEKVLNDYAAMGGGAFSLTPVVGDVLLDRHLLDRLHLLKKYPTIRPVSVTTNLVAADRFSDDELAFILDSFDKVHVSIYGLTAEHYRLLARKDNYAKVERALQRVANTGRLGIIAFGFRLLRAHTEEEIRQWIRHYLGHDAPFTQTHHYANWGIFDISSPLPFDAKWIAPSAHTEPCLIPLV
ncbi:MAG: radical SAM protein, partial [Opitutaceae bacterium]